MQFCTRVNRLDDDDLSSCVSASRCDHVSVGVDADEVVYQQRGAEAPQDCQIKRLRGRLTDNGNAPNLEELHDGSLAVVFRNVYRS